jgi:murein DD-endopeptidase MepM/ murein hydrolase activator NlpD
MSGVRRRRVVALALAGSLFLGLVVAGAAATNSLQQAVSQRHHLRQRVLMLHDRRDHMRHRFHRYIHTARLRLRAAKKGPTAQARLAGQTSFRRFVAHQHAAIRHLRHRRKRIANAIKAQVQAIKAQREELKSFIDTYGIFNYCPVDGPNVLANNFGIVVDLPGVPKHIHQGDDISAATGTPIVAPFDGEAVATRSDLAGLSVEVFGPLGHVFNAHLSSYGQLGLVQAGTIIGYVGSTGDATGPHDHFEWHPGNGPAVDPQPYLEKIC